MLKKPCTTNPNHDDCECRNVLFLGVFPLAVQDLWCGPPWAVTMLRWSALNWVQALGGGNTKVCDPGVTGSIHKDIQLGAVSTTAKQDLG